MDYNDLMTGEIDGRILPDLLSFAQICSVLNYIVILLRAVLSNECMKVPTVLQSSG